jgi:hypothetical protein
MGDKNYGANEILSKYHLRCFANSPTNKTGGQSTSPTHQNRTLGPPRVRGNQTSNIYNARFGHAIMRHALSLKIEAAGIFRVSNFKGRRATSTV